MDFASNSPFLDTSCETFDELSHTSTESFSVFPMAPVVTQEDIHEILGTYKISLSIKTPQRTQSNPPPERVKRKYVKREKRDFFPISPPFSSKVQISLSKNSVQPPRISSPIKRVATPEWQLINSKQIPKNSVHSNFSQPNYIESHKLLEMLEERIVSGVLSKYAHPAQVTIAAQELENLSWTSKEIEMTKHYEEKPAERIRPTFWEPRSWDTVVLSEETSSHLKEEMEKGESGIYFQLNPKKNSKNPRKSEKIPKSSSTDCGVEFSSDGAMMKRRRGRPRKYDSQGLKMTEVRIPAGIYETDCDDDATEWEDL